MKHIYFAFIGVLSAGMVALAYTLTTGDMEFWRAFYLTYLVSAIAHIWYTMLTLAKEEIAPRLYRPYDNERFAVVIPFYNEAPDLLLGSIMSALKAKGNKQVHVVNDGSTNDVTDVLRRAARLGAVIHSYPQNRGKRHALRYAVERIPQGVDYAIFTDSDTTFDPDTFINMVAALKTGRIGGVAGDVRVSNEKANMLTRMVGAYYWTAFNIGRKSQSALGQVACSSGALAGYRMSVLRRIMPDLTGQVFAGKVCTYGEDRHLTQLVLRDGYDVVYEPRAVAYTDSPTGWRKFLKQQLRWRRGFVQEAVFGLTFLWRVKPLLFLEVLLWEIVTPYIGAAVVLLMAIEMVFDPSIIPLFALTLAYISIVRHLPVVFYRPGYVLPMIGFTFYSFVVSHVQAAHALLTVRNTTWGTR